MDPEARVALATLDLMRSLPRYGQRVGPEERSQAGAYAEETARQLAAIEQGFTLLLDHLHRVNDLEQDAYAFSDSAWRDTWGEIALGLNQLQ